MVVLGPHRSGTSAMCALMEHAGINYGNGLINPSFDNKRGFWEKIDVIQLNELLLRLCNTSWDDYSFSSEDKPLSNNAREVVKALSDLLRKYIDLEGVTGIKDPRISLLLPIWKNIFSDLGVEPTYIIVLRDPREVAKSLLKRNGIELKKGYLLWAKYMIGAEKETRYSNRIIVEYNRMLEKPESVLSDVLEYSGLHENSMSPRNENIAQDVLVGDLRHFEEERMFPEESFGLGYYFDSAIAEYYLHLASACKKGIFDDSTIHEKTDLLEGAYKDYFFDNSSRSIGGAEDREEINNINAVESYLKGAGKIINILIPVNSMVEQYIKVANSIALKERNKEAEVVIVVNEKPGSMLAELFKNRDLGKTRIVSNYPHSNIEDILKTEARIIYLMFYGYNISFLSEIAKRKGITYTYSNTLLIEFIKCNQR